MNRGMNFPLRDVGKELILNSKSHLITGFLRSPVRLISFSFRIVSFQDSIISVRIIYSFALSEHNQAFESKHV